VSDLDKLAADLTSAGVLAGVRAVSVAQRLGAQLRDDARDLAPRKDLPHYRGSITHEVIVSGGSVVAEVGPEKGGQGSLGHILEYGTATSAPHAHMEPALDRIAPVFVEAVAAFGGTVL
jgi:hypothetical protein